MPQSWMLPVIVTQYHLDSHYKGPEYKHWSLVVLESRMTAHVHEVRGNTGTFTYVSETVHKFEQSRNLQGGYLVGYIARDKVDSLKRMLRNVNVKKYEERWDCQSWVMDALQLLKDMGLITGNIGRRHIASELGKELERWDLGGDLVHECLFPSG